MEFDDEKISFSKKVVGAVTWLFVGIIMFSAGTWLIYREIPDRLIDYVDGPFSVTQRIILAKARDGKAFEAAWRSKRKRYLKKGGLALDLLLSVSRSALRNV